MPELDALKRQIETVKREIAMLEQQQIEASPGRLFEMLAELRECSALPDCRKSWPHSNV